MSRLHNRSDLNAFQQSFSARIRNPQAEPLPDGVPEHRMRVYEELLFNNLEGFLLACYPITRKLLGDSKWQNTVGQFLHTGRCKSPLFRDIPRDFFDWMETRTQAFFPDKPYLRDFMHYEWLEMAVSILDCEIDTTEIDPYGDLINGLPVLNPTMELACYDYPVHQIGPGFQPELAEGGPYYYVLYRDQENGVQFIELNPASARLLELLQQGFTGRQSASVIAEEIKHKNPDALIEAARSQLNALRLAGVLLGTRTDL